MQQADKERFVDVLKGLAAIKPACNLTNESYEIYWLALRDWPFDDFKRAAVHLASESEFMPNPFHFEKLRKAGRPLAGEAWARVLEFARRDWRPGGGHLRDPRIEFDETTRRAVDAIGGFRAIAMSDSNSTQFLAKRFAENYDGLQDVQDTRSALPQLAARPDRVNGPESVNGLLSRLSPQGDNDGD